MIRKRADQAAASTEALARVRGALQGYQAAGAESVSIAHVLDLMNDRGMWSLDPERRRQSPGQAVSEVGADPLTGCRPATA